MEKSTVIKEHFDAVRKALSQEITNPDAIAIFLYVNSFRYEVKPEPSDIKNHFSIGDKRYRDAIRHLQERGIDI